MQNRQEPGAACAKITGKGMSGILSPICKPAFPFVERISLKRSYAVR